MKKTLTWLGVAVGSLAVFAGAGVGATLVNKDSLATHLIEKYTGSKSDSSSTISTVSDDDADSSILKVSKSTNLDSILSNGEFTGSAALNTSKKILVSANGDGNQAPKASSMFVTGKVQDTVNNGIIMHLIDSGKVKLDDKLSKYDSNIAGAESVTVKDVMDQTSGITDEDLPSSGKVASLVKEVESNGVYDATTQGTYADSRVNTILQAAIIAKASDGSYRSLVQELIDQLGLENTDFGMKQATADYYTLDDTTLSATKQSMDDLDIAEINRMASDQLVSSPADMAQMYSYLFNSDYVSSSTLKKVFKAGSGHIAGFAVDGDSISLTQAIGGGRNRVEWNLKQNTGTFLFSNFTNGQNNLATISSNMFDYLN
jgi:hypothetical protein